MTDGKHREKILIVDDVPINLALLYELLIEDYDISQAESGSVALDLAQRLKPDLILLDIMMPNMDGFEVCRRLKANAKTRGIPVIFITAKTEAEDVTRGMNLGALDYFAKPFRPAVIKARIRSHMDRIHAEQRLALEKTRELKAIQSRLAISALLETSLEPLPLNKQLTVALDIILTIPWLAVEYKGSIHLFNPVTNKLELAAQRNLSTPLLQACAVLPLGYCLCGMAAQQKKIIFRSDLDADHVIMFNGIRPHGHYCTPILHLGELLGVLNLYVTHGHTRSPDEDALLATLANTLAGIIRHRRTEQALDEERRFIATILDTTSALVAVLDPAGNIVRINAACEMLTGLEAPLWIGNPFWHAVWTPKTEQEQLREIFTLAVGEPSTVAFESQWLAETGEIRHIAWTLSFLLDAVGGLKNFLATGIDVTDRVLAEKSLERIAHHDALTGLPNRRLFMLFLQQTLARSRRHHRPLAVMFMDLDRFKAVNDNFGHDVGDLLLTETAQRIRGCLRENDVVARLGGDEFTVILADETLIPDSIAIVAQKIIDGLSAPFILHGHECRIGASIGISLFPKDGENADELLKMADLALYAVKKNGRNHYQMYHPGMASEGA
ncbi:MAG: diguanylate cyclase [Magnetococcales bacterium]|nr:diguanylate cyclase [Magnetococcales bacterium]